MNVWRTPVFGVTGVAGAFSVRQSVVVTVLSSFLVPSYLGL